jgi:sortase A
VISPAPRPDDSNVVALRPVDPTGRAAGTGSVGARSEYDPGRLDQLIELSQRCHALIDRAEAASAKSNGARAAVIQTMEARIERLEAELERERGRAREAEAQRDRLAVGAPAAENPPQIDARVVLDGARPIRGRRLMVWLAILALVVGILAVIDAFTTLVFQEPVTKLLTAHAQSVASDDLDKLETRFESTAGRGDDTGAARRVRLAAALERETGSGDAVGRLLIPSLGLKSVFVEGASEGSLKKGPGHYRETALPGEPGTVGIAGHRTTYAAPFRDLDKLKPGQRIVLRMPYGRFSYAVTGTRIVDPQDAWVLRSYGNEGGPVAAETQSRLVLTACHPIGSARQRIVVSARLASVKDFDA